MAFGLASALSFAYLPFIKLSRPAADRLPHAAARHHQGPAAQRWPRASASRPSARREAGRRASTRCSPRASWSACRPRCTGCRTSRPTCAFTSTRTTCWSTASEGDDYLVSDPVVENAVRCAARRPASARASPRACSRRRACCTTRTRSTGDAGLGATRAQAPSARPRAPCCAPVPIVGVRGMRMLAQQGRAAAARRRRDTARLYIGHIVRMQEEIGTGGAGFRFIYAAFLQELARDNRLRRARRVRRRGWWRSATAGASSRSRRRAWSRAATRSTRRRSRRSCARTPTRRSLLPRPRAVAERAWA